MKKILLLSTIFLLLISCDNMDRDDLLHGTVDNSVEETQDTIQDEEIVDENKTQDSGDTVDNYEAQDNSDTVPDDENDGPVCGNSIVETRENCDLNSMPCSSILGDNYEGTANCKADCSGFDTATCTEIEQEDVVYEIINSKCRGCGRCPRGCKEGALTMSGGLAVIDPDKCTGCGDCVAYCPFDAIKKKEN